VFANPFLGKMERAALNAGANRSLVKTEITPDALLELVRTLLPAASKLGGNKTNEPSTGESGDNVRERLIDTVPGRLPELLARARAHYQNLTKAEGEEPRRFELRILHRQLHFLAGAAGLIGRQRIAQMAAALGALAGELHDKPAQITASVLRTAAQAIDTLSFLIAAPANSAANSSSSLKILAVDDDAISREIISAALGKARLTARTLDNPNTAEALLKSEPFDLIFLDVEMPGQNGLELCLKIREMPLHRTTPVVFVTSHSDFGSRAQSTLSGGNDFIAKPFLQVELAIKALTYLFKKNFRPLPADQRSTSPMTMSMLPSMTMTSATV
jgi:CheY-like chemotaxis protein